MFDSFGPILSPMPESISTSADGVLTSSGRRPSRIRLRSSAGARFSHSGLGTTPNMAPPSSLKNPSLSEMSSKSPSTMARRLTSMARSRLFQFDEHAVRTRRMDERDARSMRAGTRYLVDELHAARLERCQRRDDVGHTKR